MLKKFNKREKIFLLFTFTVAVVLTIYLFAASISENVDLNEKAITKDGIIDITIEELDEELENRRQQASLLININTANAEELQALDEIGPVISKRIVEYKYANGLYENISDIKNVQGITDDVYNKIKDFITV